MVAKMTLKQQLFCDEYLISLNATQAAIKAGYKEKTAGVIGAENLKKPKIKEYIEARMAEKQNALIADQDEVLKYLTSVMRGEAKDEVLRFVGEGYQEKTHLQANTKDRTKAAELLGKRYGIFKENVAVDAETVVIVNDLKE